MGTMVLERTCLIAARQKAEQALWNQLLGPIVEVVYFGDFGVVRANNDVRSHVKVIGLG